MSDQIFIEDCSVRDPNYGIQTTIGMLSLEAFCVRKTTISNS